MQKKALLILVIFTLFFPQIVFAQVATVGEYCQVDTNATDTVCQALAETTCSSADSVETCKIWRLLHKYTGKKIQVLINLIVHEF